MGKKYQIKSSLRGKMVRVGAGPNEGQIVKVLMVYPNGWACAEMSDRKWTQINTKTATLVG